jgi:ABC-type bacteriocin/lantibiotic exporter with double-glycine peptidase domain/CRP-like cAMP-binding protein
MVLSEADRIVKGNQVLLDLPFVSLLAPPVRELVVAAFVPMRFAFGQSIIRQGDPPDGFYVLTSGLARVVQLQEGGEEIALGVLRRGDSFGEAALLTGEQRTATVRASSEVGVLRLEPAVFRAILQVYPEVEHALQLQARSRHLENFLRAHSAFSHLPRRAIAPMLGELRELELEVGAQVVREGDPAGPLYIVQDGRLVAYQGDDRTPIGYIRAGDFFGELSLYRGTPRAATVEAVTPVRLLALGEETFRRLLRDHPELRSAIDDQVAAYERGPSASVPLDFAEELLPAGVREMALAVMPEPVEGRLELVGTEAVADFEAESGALHVPTPGPRALARFFRRDRFPLVRQLDEMDCGVACVAMVCRYFGRAVAPSRIRLAVGTSVDGTSLRGIQRGGELVGLEVKPVRASKARLDQLPLPTIVHVDQNHWVVLHRVESDRVDLADPAIGRRRISRDKLLERWSGYAALVRPTDRLQQAPLASAGHAGWLWPFIRPHLRALILALLLTIVGAGFQMLLPVMTERVVDDVLVNHNFALLHLLGIGMIAALVAGLLASLAQGRLLSRVGAEIDAAALDDVTARLLRLPMAYFETRRTGDLQARLDGLRQARQVVIQQGMEGFTSTVQFVAAMAVMLAYSWTLGLAFIATIPLYAALLHYAGRRLKPVLEGLEEGYGRYRSTQIDAVRGIETVKSLGAEESLRRRLLTEFSALTGRIVRSDFIMLAFDGTVTLATSVIVVAFLWLSALSVLAGNLSVGGFVAFNSLVLLAIAPLRSLLSIWDQLQLTSVLIARVQDVVEHEPEQGEDAPLRAVASLEGRVTLRQVGFHYPTAPTAPILSNISLDVAPGTKVAIVGRSGSGKSTRLKCLAGLLQSTEGSIAYDRVDLRELRYPDLRRRIGFVVQQPHIFNDTIARNIAFGEDEPDLDRVRLAAQIADAHDFVERLPLGYDTLVGESGLRLSGGQQQRIAIARAIYHHPPVLLLDEATSSLDAESERAVKQNIDKLLRGRTAFIVAHRLSTVRDADLIVVLERGRIAEMGNHDELMRREGLYFYLQSQQLAR